MDTDAFLADHWLVNEWLKWQRASLEKQGLYFSHWLHQKFPGFGLVIVDGVNSGEFHLMPHGIVTLNVEHGLEVILACQEPAKDFAAFEVLFERFKVQISSS